VVQTPPVTRSKKSPPSWLMAIRNDGRVLVLALTDVSRHCTIPAAPPRQADVTPKPQTDAVHGAWRNHRGDCCSRHHRNGLASVRFGATIMRHGKPLLILIAAPFSSRLSRHAQKRRRRCNEAHGLTLTRQPLQRCALAGGNVGRAHAATCYLILRGPTASARGRIVDPQMRTDRGLLLINREGFRRYRDPRIAEKMKSRRAQPQHKGPDRRRARDGSESR
jgi:hypothetical protein